MKMQITKEDVSGLTGKFIIQLDEVTEENPTPHITITEENWRFMKEKRISFVCELKLVGYYYIHKEFKTVNDFVDYFNNYLKNCPNERYHRLLTSKEIDFISNKLKSENY